jgi:RimJ/RimL family protein N-acetyltransferase
MRVILRYAFTEMNLQRITLGVFEYNPRAIRSYEKAGFKVEGILRQYLHREGRYWDEIMMGILREEWMENEK